MRPNKSRNVVQSRSLLSKFLYHSINEEENRPASPPSQPETESPVSVRRVSFFFLSFLSLFQTKEKKKVLQIRIKIVIIAITVCEIMTGKALVRNRICILEVYYFMFRCI